MGKKNNTKTTHNKGTYEETLKQLQRQKAITWTSINNKIERQIDYVLINHRLRNSISKTQTIEGWRANMQKSNRRKVIHMQICITLAKNYRKTRHGETGTKITYDIRELKT